MNKDGELPLKSRLRKVKGQSYLEIQDFFLFNFLAKCQRYGEGEGGGGGEGRGGGRRGELYKGRT